MSFINNDIELDKELDNFVDYTDDEEIIEEKVETFLSSLNNLIINNDKKYYIEILSENSITCAKLISAIDKRCHAKIEGESILHALYLLACFVDKNTKNKISKKELNNIKIKVNIDTKVVDDNTPIYITRFNEEYIKFSLDIPDVTNRNSCLGYDIIECIEHANYLLDRFDYTDEPFESTLLFFKHTN